MTGDEWIDVLDQLTAIDRALVGGLDDVRGRLFDLIYLVQGEAGQALLEEYMKGRL